MNRLDALKARVAAATTDESRWTDYDIFVSHAREDIECLVAVVEAYLSDKVDSTDPGYPRTDDALLYWLEEEQK